MSDTTDIKIADRYSDLLCGIFPPHTKKRAMATMRRIETVDGKMKQVNYEVEVRVMAVTEGYALVRRSKCAPFVLESKRVRLIPPNGERSAMSDEYLAQLEKCLLGPEDQDRLAQIIDACEKWRQPPNDKLSDSRE